MEEDASLFTSNTATPCDYNINNGVQNSDTISEDKSQRVKNYITNGNPFAK